MVINHLLFLVGLASGSKHGLARGLDLLSDGVLALLKGDLLVAGVGLGAVEDLVALAGDRDFLLGLLLEGGVPTNKL